MRHSAEDIRTFRSVRRNGLRELTALFRLFLCITFRVIKARRASFKLIALVRDAAIIRSAHCLWKKLKIRFDDPISTRKRRNEGDPAIVLSRETG